MARSIEETRKAKREYMARKRLENPDAVRSARNAYHHQNRDKQIKKMRDYYAKRFFWGKAMKLRGKNRASTKDIASLWRKQKGMCALTGAKLDRTAQLDHKIPKCKGGSDEKANLQWLSMDANLAKRHMTDEQFIVLCASVMRWIGERIQKIEDFQCQSTPSK